MRRENDVGRLNVAIFVLRLLENVLKRTTFCFIMRERSRGGVLGILDKRRVRWYNEPDKKGGQILCLTNI